MAIQSNAFNFRSFTQGSVDPRTGLYTLGLTLPQLNANDNIGPDFPVQLSFNPLKSENVGFGLGWQLNLSTFSIRDGMLDLHTGESQYIADNGPGQPGLAPERKLDSFHFKNISEGGSKRYRVAHAAGLVEVLEPQLGDPDTALPTRIQMPSGHGINLVYDRVNGQPRLKSIHDDSKRMLLNIDYRGNQEVWIELQPGTSSVARYTLKLKARNFAGSFYRPRMNPDGRSTTKHSDHFDYSREWKTRREASSGWFTKKPATRSPASRDTCRTSVSTSFNRTRLTKSRT